MDKEYVIRRLLHMPVLYPKYTNSKPGDLVKKLSDEEREILKTVTSEDFNHRIK